MAAVLGYLARYKQGCHTSYVTSCPRRCNIYRTLPEAVWYDTDSGSLSITRYDVSQYATLPGAVGERLQHVGSDQSQVVHLLQLGA